MSKNISKIQYISVADTKIYKVKDIDFRNLTIEAHETDLVISAVHENEVFPIEELREFRIRLINGNGGQAEVIDFEDWISTHIMCV